MTYIQLYQTKIFNSNPIIIYTPTKTTTNNIKKKTIHSIFKIPIKKYLHYNNLSPYTLTILKKQFQNIHTIIINKINIINQKLLIFINKKLSKIKNNNNIFNKYNIIIINNFYQLKPIKKSFYFKNKLL